MSVIHDLIVTALTLTGVATWCVAGAVGWWWWSDHDFAGWVELRQEWADWRFARTHRSDR